MTGLTINEVPEEFIAELYNRLKQYEASLLTKEVPEDLIMLVQKDKYRSSNDVSKDHDMIRVTLDMSLQDWYKLKNQYNIIEKENEKL